MDRTIARLRRQYAMEPIHEHGMRLAGALLRVADLNYYEEQAAVGDEEIANILNYMRAIYLFEDVLEELHEINGQVYFTDPEHKNIRKYKYANVYCFGRPLASVRVYNFEEALKSKRFLEEHFKQGLLMPPERMFLNKGMARLTGAKHMLSAYPYSGGWCIKPIILLEDEPCFDFNQSAAPPKEPEFSHGTRLIQSRPLEDEDFTTVDTDYSIYTTIRRFDYDDLPEFVRPDASFFVGINEPTYATASLVTRRQVRAIDGPAWNDFYEPIAKIYLGYIYPYAIPNGISSWHWTERLFMYTCGYDQEAVQTHVEWAEEHGIHLPEWQMYPCQDAGTEHITPITQERCHRCHSDIDTKLFQPSQLERNEDADEIVPDVPESVNSALTFLQELFYEEIMGNISSVNGGQELAVHTQQDNYGPEDDSDLHGPV